MNLCTQACRGLMDPLAAWLLEDSSSPSAGGHTSLPSPAVTHELTQQLPFIVHNGCVCDLTYDNNQLK